MGAVYAYVILLTFLGPEYLKRSFDVAHDEDTQEVIGRKIDSTEGVAGQGETKGGESDEEVRRIEKLE